MTESEKHPCVVCGQPTTGKRLGEWLHGKCFKLFLERRRRAKSQAEREPGWVAILKDAKPGSNRVFIRLTSMGHELTIARHEATRFEDSVTAWKHAELASEELAMAFQAIYLS